MLRDSIRGVFTGDRSDLRSKIKEALKKESPKIVEARAVRYNIGDEVIYNGDHYIITQMSEDGACVLKNLENMDDPYIGIPVYRLERSPNITIEIPDNLHDEFFSDEETDEYDEGSIKESQDTGLYKILDDTWYSSDGTAYYCVEGPGAGNMGVRNSMESILRDKGYKVDVQLSGFGSEFRVERSVPREVLEDALKDLEAEIRKEL